MKIFMYYYPADEYFTGFLVTDQDTERDMADTLLDFEEDDSKVVTYLLDTEDLTPLSKEEISEITAEARQQAEEEERKWAERQDVWNKEAREARYQQYLALKEEFE